MNKRSLVNLFRLVKKQAERFAGNRSFSVVNIFEYVVLKCALRMTRYVLSFTNSQINMVLSCFYIILNIRKYIDLNQGLSASKFYAFLVRNL